MEYADGSTPVHIVSSDLEAVSGTDARRVALESVGLAILSVGDLRMVLADDMFESTIMPRAERIRRWVLTVGDADE